jgi:RNA polymerase subunit RPABC4/transcription elongation factor Spt4
MPIRYRCRNCGAVLYEFTRVGQDYMGVPTPREVAFMYFFTCPVCKSPLNPDTSNPDWREHIIIKPAEHSKREKRVRNSRAEKPTSEEIQKTQY